MADSEESRSSSSRSDFERKEGEDGLVSLGLLELAVLRVGPWRPASGTSEAKESGRNREQSLVLEERRSEGM